MRRSLCVNHSTSGGFGSGIQWVTGCLSWYTWPSRHTPPDPMYSTLIPIDLRTSTSTYGSGSLSLTLIHSRGL